MKAHSLIIYFGVLALALSCSVPSGDAEANKQNLNDKGEETKSEVLTVKGTAEYQMEIAYATIFNLSVHSVLQGNWSDDSLSLVVIEAPLSEKIFNANGKQFTFNFRLFQEDFKDNRMTESGVVDSSKNAWKLVSVE